MPDHNAFSRNRKRFQVVLIGAFVIGSFLASLPWAIWFSHWSHPHIATFVAELITRMGDALLIAPLLALIVEVAAQQELLGTFVRDISIHIIGHLLPKELRECIIGYLSTPFVRNKWFVEYRIVEWPGKAGFYELTTMMQYEIENRSESNKNYMFFYDVPTSWFPAVGEARIAHVAGWHDQVPIFDFNEAQLRDNGQVQQRGDFLSFKKEVRIGRQPHGVYRFIAESVECYPEGFSAPFTTKVPVLETTVRILYPKNQLKLDLELSFGDNTMLTTYDIVNGTEWIINSPMLPGQSFFARWKKIEPRVSNGDKAQMQT
jgi:hypothetical protein